MKLLLYCTKAKPYLVKVDDDEFDTTKDKYDNRILWDKKPLMNGKIVAECDFEVSIHNWYNDYSLFEKLYYQENMMFNNENSCMSSRELVSYLGDNNLKKDFYAIHIKNLHIFDEPMKLGEFLYEDNNMQILEAKPTLSQFKVIATDCKDVGGIFVALGIYGRYLSLSSEELCRVLNGEQTVIVRRHILKEAL